MTPEGGCFLLVGEVGVVVATSIRAAYKMMFETSPLWFGLTIFPFRWFVCFCFIPVTSYC